MTTRRKILLTIVLSLCILLISFGTQPWKRHAEDAIRRAFEARGFSDVQVEVASVSPQLFRLSRLALNKKIFAEDIEISFIAATSLPLRGTWKIARLHVEGLPDVIPFIVADGDFDLSRQLFHATAQAKAESDRLRVDFDLTWQLDWPDDSVLQIKQFEVRPQGGLWRLEPVSLKLAPEAAWKLQVQLSKQPIAELLAAFGQAPVSATGEVEGLIPVTIDRRAGRITFHQAELKSTGPGVLVMSPDALPGENEQLNLVRELMSGFHFERLNMEIAGSAGVNEAPDKSEKLAMHLRLEGNNPSVYDGKPVNLNINLQGDLASLLQQSLLPLADPGQWINEEKHANHP